MRFGKGLLILGALCLSGCSEAQVSSGLYGYTDYPPTDPGSVQILREFPSDGFVKIGEVSVDDYGGLFSTETKATFEAKLRWQVASMGGDAVVIREDKPSWVEQKVRSDSETYKDSREHVHTVQEVEAPMEHGRKVYGVAIRFTE